MSFKQLIQNATFSLKKSLGNRKPFPFECSLGARDYWCLLLIGCISLFISKLAWIIPAYLLFKTTTKKIQFAYQSAIPKEVEQVVHFIQSNHLQSLTEAIESNPDLLYCDYKKQSLLSWCKYYNNTKALMVVIQMSKKYPRRELIAA